MGEDLQDDPATQLPISERRRRELPPQVRNQPASRTRCRLCRHWNDAGGNGGRFASKPRTRGTLATVIAIRQNACSSGPSRRRVFTQPRPEAAILTAEVAYCDSVLAGPLAQLGLQRRWRPDHDARLQSASHCRRESAVWRHCQHGVFIAWLGVAVLSANDMVVVPIRSGMRLRLGRLRPRCYSQAGPHEPIAARAFLRRYDRFVKLSCGSAR
jgi:hypothetical protein